MTDDLVAHAVSAYGSKVNETPYMDLLARLKNQIRNDAALSNELPPDGVDREPPRRDAAPTMPGA